MNGYHTTCNDYDNDGTRRMQFSIAFYYTKMAHEWIKKIYCYGDTEGRKRYNSIITVATQEHYNQKDTFCSNNHIIIPVYLNLKH
jgi:hypothetical protein